MIASAATQKIDLYIDAVMSGEQSTCRLVRAAIERHVKDLNRQSSTGFPYHYDPQHAAFVVDFFETMLCHSIGECATLPFILEPWQAFAVGSIIGWKRDDDNSRRFRKVYWSMARKNGKSTVAAGLAIYLAMLDKNPVTGQPEAVADIILSATKREQANVIYSEIERMRHQSKYIRDLSTTINKQVRFQHNSGTIRCVGSDRPYDGLNPHTCVVDELHAFREHHRPFFQTLMTASGYRTQPLTLMVTTAGNDQSLLWREEYEYARDVVLGLVRDEQMFAYCFELDEKDDPLDETNWIKANPNLGVSVKPEFLHAQATEAKRKPLKKLEFTQYHGNRLVSATERAFDMAEWDAAEGELSDWTKADCITAAVDLGSRDDFAAYGLCARFLVSEEKDSPVYRYELKSRAYIADDSPRDLSQQPFAEFIYEDLLRVDKYPILALRNDLFRECEELGVYQMGYDPAGGLALSEEAKQEGFEPIRIGQSCQQFNEPIRELLICLRDGRVSHDGNKMLRWCASNTVLISNAQGRYMYDKASSKQKIDPIVSCTMAFRLATIQPAGAQGSLFL